MKGKFLAVLPLASSSSPASGDHYLVMRFDDIQRHNNQQETYARAILKGNDQYFVILIVDAGFVHDQHNKPREVQDSPTLQDICDDCHAVLLHTSTKHVPYCLARDLHGKIIKVPIDDPDVDTTSIQNTIKFTRLFRIVQEMVHGSLKKRFKYIDAKHLHNSTLLALKPHQLRKFGLPDAYINVPKLSYIYTVCCSIHNKYHPGYSVLYIREEDQIAAADRLMTRMFLKNPLLHDSIWPSEIKFDSGSSAYWTKTTFGNLSSHSINFPQLDSHQINPVATDMVSGPHAIGKSFSLATYMGQLLIKERNLDLTRQETEQFLRNFPVDWKVQFCHVRAPPDFVPTPQNPVWIPPWYDVAMFDQWPGDICFVRAKIPPSHKSATSPANFHMAVIGFVENPTDRLRLLPPYDRIVMWRCYNCPALNGSLSMCRHIATLLLCISYPQEYRSTFASLNVFSSVGPTQRQPLVALPPTPVSQPIPDDVPRRRASWRTSLPQYDTAPGATAAGSAPTAGPTSAGPTSSTLISGASTAGSTPAAPTPSSSNPAAPTPAASTPAAPTPAAPAPAAPTPAAPSSSAMRTGSPTAVHTLSSSDTILRLIANESKYFSI